MLVLSRKEKETIRIGEIEVTIVRISGNRVTVAIKADKGVRILRGELLTGQGDAVASAGR